MPQIAQYDAVTAPKVDGFPLAPETFTENPPGLLRALHDATQTTDPEPIRFSTDHVRLRGASGQIEATDGRQLLVQSGFEFPWDDDVLILRTMVFGCRELPDDQDLGSDWWASCFPSQFQWLEWFLRPDATSVRLAHRAVDRLVRVGRTSNGLV